MQNISLKHLIVGFLIFGVALASGCRRSSKADPFSDQKELNQLQIAFEKEMQSQLEIQTVKNLDDQKKIDQAIASIRQKYASKFQELAENSSNREVQAEALVHVIRLQPVGRSEQQINSLLEDYVECRVFDQTTIQQILLRKDGIAQTKKLLKENSNQRVQVVAKFELAQHILQLLETRKEIQAQEKVDADALARVNQQLQKRSDSEIEKEAVELLRTVANDDQGLMDENSMRLKDISGAIVFSLEHLRVNKPAPEIIGKDIDGKELKLSDFRGKTVLLSFWGKWCGPCRALIDVEKSIEQKFGGNRFVILGVNSDEDPETVRLFKKEKKITWPSFWDGGTDGDIACAWEIEAWPTVFLIDPEGIIRFHETGRANVERAVEALLKEIADNN